MQLVIFNFFYSYRLKSAESYMQGDLGNFNSASTNLFKRLRCEVQARRWCCHRPARLRIHSLVAVAVLCLVAAVVVAMNVGRKRNLSDALDARKEIGDRSEADSAFSNIAAADYLGFHFGLDSG